MIDRKELRKMLPFGYGRIIAQKVGVGENSVSLYFAGKINSHKIEQAVLDTISELQKVKRSKIEEIYGTGFNKG